MVSCRRAQIVGTDPTKIFPTLGNANEKPDLRKKK
jgi:hypothetical protein